VSQHSHLLSIRSTKGVHSHEVERIHRTIRVVAVFVTGAERRQAEWPASEERTEFLGSFGFHLHRTVASEHWALRH